MLLKSTRYSNIFQQGLALPHQISDFDTRNTSLQGLHGQNALPDYWQEINMMLVYEKVEIILLSRAHLRTSSKWLWIRHIHSYVYNSFRIQRVDIRFDVLVSGVWKGTIYGLRLNMAENENTFVILQSLLTCVCERENHGSTKGKWGIGNG